MAVTDHYGELVYTAIDEAISDPFVRSQLSAPTLANVGSFLVSAYEVSAAGWEGGAITAVFDVAMDIAFDLAAELASELMALVADIVPILLGILEGIFNIFQEITKTDKQEQAKKRLETAQKCRDKAQLYEAIPTDVEGYAPADYFVQGERGEFTVEGKPEYIVSGRMPFIGRLIELITETQYNNFFFEWGLQGGYGLGPIGQASTAASLIGIPVDFYELAGGKMIKGPQQMRAAGLPFCYPPQWPVIGKYKPALQQLRKAIIAQSIAARQAEGMSDGDGGSSLWPLYQDLIWSAVRQQQYVTGDEVAGQPGYAPRPPLNEQLVRMLYAPPPPTAITPIGGMEPPAVVRGLNRGVSILGAKTSDVCSKENPWTYDRAIELGAECVGNWEAGLNGFFRMVDAWGYNVRPVYADDQARQAEMLEQTYTAMSSAVRGRLKQMDLVKPTAGITGATQAINAISKLRKQGIISESAAQEGASAVNAGAKPSAFPAVLAAAALGFVLLKGR